MIGSFIFYCLSLILPRLPPEPGAVWPLPEPGPPQPFSTLRPFPEPEPFPQWEDEEEAKKQGRDLRAEAKSLRHKLTHMPKNKYCAECRMAKAQARRTFRGASFMGPRGNATSFGNPQISTIKCIAKLIKFCIRDF